MIVDYFFDLFILFGFLLLVPLPLVDLNFREACQLRQFFLDAFVPLGMLLKVIFHDCSLIVIFTESLALVVFGCVARTGPCALTL